MPNSTNFQSDTAIYLVLSQTGTLLSRLLKYITKAKYNHISISLDKNLQHMYSFSRRNAYNPVWGGFMMESPFYGAMRRFRNTKAIIMRVPVSDRQYQELENFLVQMYAEKEKYHYNISGLLLASLGIVYHQKNKYYCSEFVRDTLEKFKIVDTDYFNPITIPEDFLRLDKIEIIYIGNLREYAIHYTPEMLIQELLQPNIFRKMLLKLENLL